MLYLTINPSSPLATAVTGVRMLSGNTNPTFNWSTVNPLSRMRPGNISPGDAVPAGRFTRSITGNTDHFSPIPVQNTLVWVAAIDNFSILQLDHDPTFLDLAEFAEFDDRCVQVTVVPPVINQPWDTDSEQQRQQGTFITGDVDLADSGIELITLPALPPLDTDADQQKQQVLSYDTDRDLIDAGTELITLPSLPSLDTEADQQRAWPIYDTDRDLADSGVELITLPALPPLDQDIWADQPNAPYQFDRDLADSGVELITLPPLPPLDLDVLSDRQWIPYDLDRDLADTSVERIQLPPLPPLDTDADWQPQASKWPFVYDSDEDKQWTDLIILPPLVTKMQFWDTDSESQIPTSPYQVEAEHIDRSVRIILPPLPPFDTDADWQPQVSKWPFAYDAEEDRQWTNLIILPPLVTKVQFWDTDAENQIPSFPYTVEAVEHQDRSNLVILPSLPPLDTDTEQQRSHPDTFRWDSQELREGTNFIVLPPAPWVYELMDQLKQDGVGIPAQASDQGQDWQYLIILPPPVVTQPFDTDADQQRQAADWAVERETSEPAPFIVYAPGVLAGWDIDEKSQVSNEVRFTDRMVEMQDRSNLIVLPFLPPFDTDADAQFEHPKVPGAAKHEWTHEWIVSIVATLVRKAMALLYARSGPQAFAVGGGRATQIALLPAGQRVVNQTAVLSGGFSTDFASPIIANLPSGVDVPTGYGTGNYGQSTYD